SGENYINRLHRNFLSLPYTRNQHSSKSTSSGNKWHLKKIYPRHFIATAETVGFCTIRMEEILDEFVESFPNAIDQVVSHLPNGFPAQIIDSIVSNSLRILGKIKL
ncbi:hypothetical protein ACPV4X_25750, partial [Vibrio owensii]